MVQLFCYFSLNKIRQDLDKRYNRLVEHLKLDDEKHKQGVNHSLYQFMVDNNNRNKYVTH